MITGLDNSDVVALDELGEVVVELEDIRAELEKDSDLEADIEHRAETHFGAENDLLLTVVHLADAVPDLGKDLLDNGAIVELDTNRQCPVVKVGLLQPLRILRQVGGNLLVRSVWEVRMDLVRVLEAVGRDELAEERVLIGRPDLPQFVHRRALSHVAGDKLVQLLRANWRLHDLGRVRERH